MNDSGDPLDLMVRKLESHTVLDEGDRAALLALPHVIRKFEASAYLVREGDSPDQCFVLASGFAYRQKHTSAGTRQIVSIHLPGEMLDLQHLYLDFADHNVQALTRVEVAVISRSAIRDLVRARPNVARAIFVSVLVESSIFREWVLNLGRRTSRSRLAHLLCEFAIRVDAQGLSRPGASYELPMTQEQIGDALGLIAVHVNRTIKGLEAEGLIKRDKRQITFPQREALCAAGDFSERYLHLGQQRQ